VENLAQGAFENRGLYRNVEIEITTNTVGFVCCFRRVLTTFTVLLLQQILWGKKKVLEIADSLCVYETAAQSVFQK